MDADWHSCPLCRIYVTSMNPIGTEQQGITSLYKVLVAQMHIFDELLFQCNDDGFCFVNALCNVQRL